MHEMHCTAVTTSTIAESEATTYGVTRRPILNESRYFNVVDGMAPDIMHDFLEGVLPLAIMMLLKNYICTKGLFRIDLFNSRLKSFCFGPIEATNKPIPLKQSISTASETAIKQSGRTYAYLLYI